MRRAEAPELDRSLGRAFPVLDDGFVRAVDYMGSDQAIVQAARVSYGTGTKQVHEDRGLIRYLLRNHHTTPFEMCEVKLHVRVPMDTWRQWIRHRTASVNEYSTRYSVAIDSAQRTQPTSWRQQSSQNRQGSSEAIPRDIGERLSASEEKLLALSRATYKERLELGVAREQARKDLPLSTYTEAYWKIDAHNLMRFLRLRLDNHAQFEIREYARVISNEVLRPWLPMTWEAFQDYDASVLVLSRQEQHVVRALICSPADGVKAAIAAGFLDPNGLVNDRHRELREFETKLDALGMVPPWRT